MSDVGVLYLRGLDFFGDVVDRMPASDWGRPTPCAGWTATDVLGHVGAATRFGTAVLTGRDPGWTPVEPPGAVVEGEPRAWWHALEGEAGSAVRAADVDAVVATPAGPRSVGDGLTFPAIDLYVHGWDLGRSAALEVTIPDEAVAFAEGVLAGLPTEQVRSPSVFAAEVAVGADASASQALLAWTGRDPHWSPR